MTICVCVFENREKKKKTSTQRHTKATKQCACQTKKRRWKEKKVNVDVYATKRGTYTCAPVFFSFFSFLFNLQTLRNASTIYSCFIYTQVSSKKNYTKLRQKRNKKQTHGMLKKRIQNASFFHIKLTISVLHEIFAID
jgi:hypothetical protein